MSRLGEQDYGRRNGTCFPPYAPSSDGSKPMEESEKTDLDSSAMDKDTSSDSSRTRSSSPPWVLVGENYSNRDSIPTGSSGAADGVAATAGEGTRDKKEAPRSESGSSMGSSNTFLGSLASGVRSDGIAGNGRSRSFDSEDDRVSESSKKKKPHRHRGGSSNGNKETSTKSKMQDEDDEATDSADEGEEEEDTPNSMIMDFNPPSVPHSNHSSTSDGVPPTFSAGPSGGNARGPTSQFSSGGSFRSNSSSSTSGLGVGGTGNGRSSGNRTGTTPSSQSSNHYEENGTMEDTPSLLSVPLREKSPPTGSNSSSRSGTIAVESMAPVETSTVEQASGSVSMIVGYGVPAASVPPQENKSLPDSEAGTPTLDDSPSPAEEEKVPGTPLATPMATTPVLSPAITLLPQVS